MMLIKETLSRDEKLELLSGGIVGVFTELFKPEDEFYTLAPNLCLGYYTFRSANKKISQIYNTTIELFKDISNEDIPIDEIIPFINIYIGQDIIRPKFIDKWNKIYKLLISDNYNAINDFEYTETREKNDTDTTTYNNSIARTGENSDTITYDNEVVSDGNRSVKETTSFGRDTNDDIYAFNSVSPVGDSVSEETSSETIIADKDDNTTHNSQAKTGSDTKNIIISENESKTGDDTKTFESNENISKNGRNRPASELIESEISMRNREVFFDIIYTDIDSVITCGVYN